MYQQYDQRVEDVLGHKFYQLFTCRLKVYKQFSKQITCTKYCTHCLKHAGSIKGARSCNIREFQH